MLVVVQNGGKQYMLESGKTIECEKMDLELGSSFHFDASDILLVHDGDKIVDDKSGVRVECKVLSHGRAEKIVVFKKQRRTSRFTKTRGHRQSFTSLLVTSIVLG